MDKPKIFFCDLTNTGQTIATNCFPLPVGMIAAYLKKQLNDRCDVKIFKYPEKLLETVLKERPDIIAFSNFMWNQNLNRNMAKRIKADYPEVMVVFGGPNLPLDSPSRESFLKNNGFIDIYITGEGETAFEALANGFIKNPRDVEAIKREGIQNCSYILDGKLIENQNRSRIKNLSEIPSPYTTGLLDEFFDGKLIPLVEFTRGCPFTCLYCDQSNPYHTPISRKSVSDVREELEYIAKRVKGAKDLFIADSNFGMFKEDIDVAKIIAEVKQKYGWPEYIQVATGKSNKEMVLEVARILEGGLRLGAAVQSMDTGVLKNIKRDNISIPEIIKIVKEANTIDANTYSEMILALPGDSKKIHFESIRQLIQSDVNFIRLFVLMPLQGTPMATEEFREKYGLKTKFRVLARGFGNYQYKSSKIPSVEIEEIVVASNTLPFGDYLDCRRFALTLELFYNDCIIDELKGVLKSLGISYFDLLVNIDRRINETPGGLQDIYDRFIDETKSELWDDKNGLEKHAIANMDKYIDGTYGSNLLFKYKSMAFLMHLKEVYDIAFSELKDLVFKKSKNKSLFPFLDDLKAFSFCRKDSLFEMKPIKREFDYDIIAIQKNGFRSVPSLGSAPPAKGKHRLLFYHDDEQKRMIQGYLDKYGSDVTGLTRVFTRMMMKNAYRKVTEH
jgi:radical SAM superfamily enzyme YgiQ (UPF0313 family)